MYLTKIACVAAAAIVAATTLSAEPVNRLDPIPDGVRALLEGEGQTDAMAVWRLDLDGDGAPEYLAQAAYVLGGAAGTVFWKTFRVEMSPLRLAGEIDLDTFVKDVATTDDGVILTVADWREGDPRSNPMGEKDLRIAH